MHILQTNQRPRIFHLCGSSWKLQITSNCSLSFPGPSKLLSFIVCSKFKNQKPAVQLACIKQGHPVTFFKMLTPMHPPGNLCRMNKSGTNQYCVNNMLDMCHAYFFILLKTTNHIQFNLPTLGPLPLPSFTVRNKFKNQKPAMQLVCVKQGDLVTFRYPDTHENQPGNLCRMDTSITNLYRVKITLDLNQTQESCVLYRTCHVSEVLCPCWWNRIRATWPTIITVILSLDYKSNNRNEMHHRRI